MDFDVEKQRKQMSHRRRQETVLGGKSGLHLAVSISLKKKKKTAPGRVRQRLPELREIGTERWNMQPLFRRSMRQKSGCWECPAVLQERGLQSHNRTACRQRGPDLETCDVSVQGHVNNTGSPAGTVWAKAGSAAAAAASGRLWAAAFLGGIQPPTKDSPAGF